MAYTKKDFLTAFQYAKKHNLDKNLVLSVMALSVKNNETIKVHTTQRSLVFKKSNTYYLRPEDSAQSRFAELIQEFKTKGKTK